MEVTFFGHPSKWIGEKLLFLISPPPSLPRPKFSEHSHMKHAYPSPYLSGLVARPRGSGLLDRHRATSERDGTLLDDLVHGASDKPHPWTKQDQGMVDALDQSVGAVMEALYEAQMLDNSIVVFSSDNGGSPFGFHATRSFNWPLRGSKGTHWEGGTRAAAFIWSPLLRKRRRVSHQMMHITDWLPTLYHAAGGHKERLEGRLDGYNMWDVLSRNLSSPRIEVLYNIEPQQSTAALRYYDYKLVEGVSFGGVWDDRFPTPGGKRPHADLDELMANSTVARVLRGVGRSAGRRGAGVVGAGGPVGAGSPGLGVSWSGGVLSFGGPGGRGGLGGGVGLGGVFPRVWGLKGWWWGGGVAGFLGSGPPGWRGFGGPGGVGGGAVFAFYMQLLAKLQKRLDRYRKSAVAPRNKDADPLGFPECDRETWGPWVDPPNDSQKL
ncbi:hypothetical protein HPB48_011280 [Haemaphysalis longicornis]|uniref:Sulfatase N-terminal domain-containing protein n=1 Tax=Haemaphysalis longicornis TaxID=44386 RepID=A0A9J6G5Z1_HAELO|nr:hypothetical protein HPB48_011280 [Haemaphysalis longicornis]